ncbi:MAG TPA: proteasome activator, partial [Streptosporangiaceae bacterium]|nr:proteasome activator [Streptosporangiaceae bacterium]
MTEQPNREQPAGKLVILGPDGTAAEESADQAGERPLIEMVEQPAKVMRIGSMIR